MMSGVSALLWQAALMLLGAYFIGTFLGCWLRRRFNAPPQVAMESPNVSSTSARAPAPVTAASSDRFGRALDGGNQSVPSPEIATTASPPPLAAEGNEGAPTTGISAGNAPAGAVSDVSDQTTVPLGSERRAAQPRTADLLSRIPPEEPPPTPIAPAGQPTAPLTPPMSASAAAAAARAARLAVSNRPTPDAVQSGSAPAPGLMVSTADKLEQLTPAPTADLPASAGSAGQAIVAAQIEQVVVPVSDGPDDLTLIKGVTDVEAAVLRDAGFTTFSSIADWSSADVLRVSAMITGERRISRENWIEQAQLLKNGGSTAYTNSVPTSVTPRPEEVVPASSDVRLAGVPATELTTSDRRDDENSSQDTASEADEAIVKPLSEPSAGSGPTAGADVSARAAFARERGGYADDLQQIDGINGEVEKLLNEQGVTRIAQIAGWPPEEQQRIDRMLGGMNRIRRENWVGQARRISGFSEIEDQPADDQAVNPTPPSHEPIPDGEITTSADDAAAGDAPDPVQESGETEASESNILPLGDAAGAARNNVSSFRSVRSHALVGDAPSIDPSNPGDDLKRIRGIGVLIEKRLRAMGYTSYEQIGSWTQSDVDRVNQKLDFRGRIERENWIEQARILAAGGQTEFSRRQERDDD